MILKPYAVSTLTIMPLPLASSPWLRSDALCLPKVGVFLEDEGFTSKIVQWPSLSHDGAILVRACCCPAADEAAMSMLDGGERDKSRADGGYTIQNFFPTKGLIKSATGTKVPKTEPAPLYV